MYKFQAFYKGKQITVEAETAYQAQQTAAKKFKAKKSFDVIVILHGQNPDCMY